MKLTCADYVEQIRYEPDLRLVAQTMYVEALREAHLARAREILAHNVEPETPEQTALRQSTDEYCLIGDRLQEKRKEITSDSNGANGLGGKIAAEEITPGATLSRAMQAGR